MTARPPIRVLPTAQAVAEEAARLVREEAERSAAARGRFLLALSGGRTPQALYALLAQAGPRALPYEQMEVFWSDERAVPPDDRDSNYRRAWEVWLSRVPIPPDRLHRIAGEADPSEAAAAYEVEIRRVAGDPPQFDLVLLGIGADGHTASLFPGDAALDSERLVVAASAPVPPHTRVTFTFRLIEGARQVLVLVTGRDKAEAVRRALGDPFRPELPAARLRWPHVAWLLDEAAGAGLR